MEPDSVVYRVASDLALEHFGEESLVFLASTDTFIRVNQAAGVLLDLIIEKFGENAFSAEELAELLQMNYSLDAAEAMEKSHEFLVAWAAHDIFVQGHPPPR